MPERAQSTATIADAATKEPVAYELDEGIATIALDDGKVNALSIETLRARHGALDRAERDGAVTILRGRPGYLSAGFDLKVFGEGIERVLEMLTLGATLTERLLSLPAPVVLACSGHAVAAGSFLTLSADARIGADGPFQIGLNEVKIGLTVPWFAIELARHRLSPAHFDSAVVSARMYGPQEAVAAGFVDRVVAPEQLDEAALATARTLAQLDMRAHAASKLRAREDVLRRLRAAIETELTLEGLGAAQGDG
ncbi:MAG: crotonase/enoyl-CoA hydratase family protein [Solirubrobacterales bacterium]